LQETLQEGNENPRVTKFTTERPANFNRFNEMNEQLPQGQLSNTFAHTQREYQGPGGQHVEYTRELTTSNNYGNEAELLKEEERRIVEQQKEPGLIERLV
jgi:hypothetical protein